MEDRVQKRTGRLAVLFFLVSAGLLFIVVKAFVFLSLPPSPRGQDPIEKILEIPDRTTLRQTARLLFQNGLIKSIDPFVAIGKLLALERHIIPGEYEFNTHMLPLEIIDRLKTGKVVRYRITIPEGYSMVQIADLVEERRLAPSEDFLRRAKDPEFIRRLGYELETLEGYLYPDSYAFSRKAGVDVILRTLVRTFASVFTDEMKARAETIGMTQHEVITLAAIIEKETSDGAERGMISAVFHNRIRKNMRLQSDPTVIYAVPRFDGNLTRRHLKIRSPYNTYWVKGLPPGPIANPGKAAMLAALYPVPVDYLYFVSKNNGTHYFSKTLAEHNRAVRKYQLRRS